MQKWIKLYFHFLNETKVNLLSAVAAQRRVICCQSRLLLPADVCLNFSLFFFLHFQGLNRRPKVANLLLRRMGGVCVPGTSESERIAAKRSTSSAGRRQKEEVMEGETVKTVQMGRRVTNRLPGLDQNCSVHSFRFIPFT